MKGRATTGLLSIECELRASESSPIMGRLVVRDDGGALLIHDHFPIGELAPQLDAWESDVDDDARCRAFHFMTLDPDFIGSFRIEPRPVGWQFTSRFELRRRAPDALPDVRAAVRSFLRRVRAAPTSDSSA